MNILNLLQESCNMIIHVETNEDISYKGTVTEIDDYMNICLRDVDVTADNGVLYTKSVFIRGSCIKLIVLPPILKELCVYKK